ncbi:MAG: sulfurtransferase complex subunit TusC [Telmatospirillum sp.]|nr:sulfurtransferase complex subunit TusC [Telmatospirillum sp.]
MRPKRLLFVARCPPHGGARAAEMLDAALIAASFGQDVHLAFLDDGVFQLLADQQPGPDGPRNFAAGFADLDDYDIDPVWVERDSLGVRGLSAGDLMIPVTLLDRRDLAERMAEMDVVIGS